MGPRSHGEQRLMQRYENWPIRLQTYLQGRAFEQFEYGRMDCCLFVCGAIAAMTGIDPAEPFRQKYGTREQAMAAVRGYSGIDGSVRTVTELVTAELGMAEVPVRQAQRGDLLLLRRSRDWSLALVALNGREMAVLTRRQGVRLLPIQAERAWRV